MKKKKNRLALVFMGVFVLLVFGLIILELVQIQIADNNFYLEERNNEFTIDREMPAARGEILLSDGTAIVKNIAVTNVVIDKVKLPEGRLNETIIRLSELLIGTGEPWFDTLPITKSAPFEFIAGEEERVVQLKEELGKQDYSTAGDILAKLYELFEVDQSLTDAERRIIIGVRYEMMMAEFSLYSSYVFAENISDETMLKLREGSFYYAGVTTETSTMRQYASGILAPHLWGMVGPIYKEDYESYKALGYKRNETVGKGGIEESFEAQLRGTPGLSRITLSPSGEIVNEEVITGPIPGHTIITTIDPEIQLVAQQSLEREIKKLQQTAIAGQGREAAAGVVGVLEIKTGNILALAQFPSYDISTYRSMYSELIAQEDAPLFNRALSGQYAPGSAYKPLIAVAGLAEGIIDRASHVFCAHVYRFYDDYQPTCLSFHGNTTVLKALQRSCNIFFYDTGRQLGIERINAYASQFGLGAHTGIELKEAIGMLAGSETALARDPNWVVGDVLQASIGQSLNQFSPLQILNYTATLARNGRLLETHLVGSVVSYNQDEVISLTEAVEIGRMNVSAEVFDTVKEGMVMATDPGGTSSSWVQSTTFNFKIASKTGTPQTPKGTNSVYICFAPADDPVIAIVAIIEDGWHGYTSAPVAKDIMNAYFFENYSDFEMDLEKATALWLAAREEEKKAAIAAESSEG